MIQKNKLNSEHRKTIELAYGNALRLERLVNSLLDFSRLEAGKSMATYRPTDLSQLTHELSHNFESAAKAALIGYDIDSESLGEPVYVDTNFWEKIVLNLLSNAFKHTFNGSIFVRLRRENNMAKLLIRDTGTGIPKDEIPHLFERFYQVRDVKSRSNEGSGIGLALVRELVELHGGTISVDSVENEGTTVTVLIPFGTAHLPKKQIEKSTNAIVHDRLGKAFMYEVANWTIDETDKIKGNTANTEATILVVDDNMDMRYYIKSILGKNKNWRIMLANDGVDALKFMETNSPDVILSDIMMPQMDGYELVRQTRRISAYRDTPIILLSARAGEEAKNDGMAIGADDYLVKPFTANELVTRVGAHLRLTMDRKSAHREELKRMREMEVAKNNFINQVSHLLRAPATSVKEYTGLLLKESSGGLTRQQRKLVEQVYESNELGLTIVGNLLQEAKVDKTPQL